MAVSGTVTPGKIFADGETVTISELNKLGTPTVDISGAVGTLSLTDGSVTNAKVASSAGIQLDKLQATTSGGQVLLGNSSNVVTATSLTGDVTVSDAGVTTIGNDKVTTAKVLDANVTEAKLAAAVISKLVPTGSILAYVKGSAAPTGWLYCDGSAVSRSTYADLYAVIGDNYGEGDGTTTFNLPDLRGRVPVGADGAAARLSSNDALGQTGGTETHTLTEAEMPSHTHDTGLTGMQLSPSGGSGGVMPGSGLSTASTGGDGAHNNMQPYQVVEYIVKS